MGEENWMGSPTGECSLSEPDVAGCEYPVRVVRFSGLFFLWLECLCPFRATLIVCWSIQSCNAPPKCYPMFEVPRGRSKKV